MENLLLESADKLLRYKGMLWIDGQHGNRPPFQGVQRLYSADWDRPWLTKNRIARWCLSGFSCRRMRFGGVCGVEEDVNSTYSYEADEDKILSFSVRFIILFSFQCPFKLKI